MGICRYILSDGVKPRGLRQKSRLWKKGEAVKRTKLDRLKSILASFELQ